MIVIMPSEKHMMKLISERVYFVFAYITPPTPDDDKDSRHLVWPIKCMQFITE